ncbi:MAG TPA: PAS domain-containing protein [Dehalococcoidia bacterium]|nr:PAS domain-containing protein [Dehalococcoidia bacterium]
MSPRRASTRSSAPEEPAPRAPRQREEPPGLVEQITLALAPLPGEQFLLEVPRHLARMLDVTYAFVAEDPDGADAWIMAAFSDGQFLMHDRPFRVRSTPYEAIRASGRLFVSDRISRMFPGDAWLRHHGIASTLALPLIYNGTFVGAIGVMERRPITSPALIEAILGVLAPRAAGLLEHRRLDRKLMDDEQKFRLIADHAIDVVFRFSLYPEPHFDYVSPSLTRLVGHTPEEFLADPNVGLRILHPDDRYAVFEQVRDPKPRTMTVRLITPNGDIAWVEIASFPVLAEDGSLAAVEAIGHDVTDRVQLADALRESERRYRTIVDAFPDMTFRIDAAGRYLEFVPASGQQLVASPEDFVGRSLLQVLPEDAGTRAMQAVGRALRTGEPQSLEYDLSDPGGPPRCYEVRMVPIADDEVIAFVRDITLLRTPGAAEPGRAEGATTAIEREIAARAAYGLTAREVSVLMYLARGAADKQIAEALGLSAFTINKHVASILSKMHVSSRTAAGVKAVREGIAE